MSIDAHTDHDGHERHPQGSLNGYLIGFGLSVVLTAIPFWLVMADVLDNKIAAAISIMAFAAVQIVVHMIFFLHMKASSEGGWVLMAVAFTLIIVVITLSGSLWVMYHLNTNMMPTLHEMNQLP